MPATLLNTVAQSSAQRLVNSFVPRQNASTRFSLWMAALLSIATLPMAEMLARVDGPATEPLSHSLTLPASWGIALFTIWALISLFLVARLAFGVVQLVRLRASAVELDLTSLPEVPRQTLIDFQPHRRVRLCISDRVSVPTAVGLFRPAVVLPRWTLTELSPANLNSVLVHELAHLRRRDDWTNLLQKLVRAVFFFHPAVWWIEGRLSLEREMACDEHVLTHVADARGYAECLVSLAERGFLHRAMSLAQGAVHRVKECSARVAQILGARTPQTARASRLALFSGASGLVLLLGTFAQAPDLIAFNSPATSKTVAADHEPSPAAMITPATWHPNAQSAAVMTPAVYKPQATVKQVRKQTNSKDLRVARASSLERRPTAKTNPMLYRAGLTARSADAAPEALLIVRQASFYPDGTAVWSVAVYRMTVAQTQPQTTGDFSRKAI